MTALAPTVRDTSVRSALLSRAHEHLNIHAQLPRPGSGRTLHRWQQLAAFGAEDACLAKLLEAHYDALAILAELGEPEPPPGELWAVWAAEPPAAKVDLARVDSMPILNGTKAWCSGAQWVSHALMTVRQGDRGRLVAVSMDEKGITHDASAWQAVGMARIVSGTVHFSDVVSRPIGAPGAYLDRPGFWHGGAGIAACWYGAASCVAQPLRAAAGRPGGAHAMAHLGRVDTILCAGAAMLRELAHRIDHHPEQAHQRDVTRVRSYMERAASEVIDRVGRALGAGPLCLDGAHAQRTADLQVFIRQSHAEKDWEFLGRALDEREVDPWTL